MCVGLIALGFERLDLFAQVVELGFLLVEFAGVALEESLFLGSAFQGFHVFAEAGLIGDDAVDVFLAIVHVFFQFGDGGFLRSDFLEGVGDSGGDGAVLGEDSDLFVADVA